ncbi:P-loop containing nucleoside triphosphate hydrolase protein [Mycena metata]|uniref:P-loop containing nucleoside triphosphate hydrolase protein n=1 Tax=Mycena metata TaxID=1033252 RepID=A0AAD7IPT6_9AGAR|nr:P-loop containing nucleoside triphosphate hydrolase protein [Mycena metata]
MEGPCGSNVLNKQMQGLWSTHRRGRMNLNAPPPTPPVEETLDNAPEDQASCICRFVTNGKRKVRSSRTDDSTASKRPKISGGGAISKDHTPPTARLADLGGIEGCIEKLLELVAMPLCHPEIYLHTGVQAPRGVLLHGPPGSGKTLLANAIAGELGVPFISISAPSIVSGMSGESEKTLRDTFEEAKRVAPCLLFIDEIDAITPKRESAQREMERRIVAQFLTCMDEMSWDKTDNKPVIVMGATNRPDSLDAALRRAGRFDHEISMGVPDEAAPTPGYVGADLAALTGAAGIIAVKRIFKQLSDGTLVLPSVPAPDQEQGDVLMADPSASTALSPALTPAFTFSFPIAPTASSIAHFLNATFKPSAQREGFATVPDVTWADIGALHGTRDALQMAIVLPLRRPLLFRSVGIAAPCGVLLWGPPGCGKTLLAKAVANESQANFISVKGPELLNKYVGESERAVRQVSESSARVVNTLLTELDGLDARKSVYVVAATNRPDMIDPAMVRPGRLDKLLYNAGRSVRTVMRGVPLGGAESAVEQLVQDRCEGYSGADLASLVREAGVSALRRTLGRPDQMDVSAKADAAGDDSLTVTLPDFVDALDKVGPSVSVAQRRKYEALRAKFAGLPVRVGKEEEEKRVDA